MQIKYCRNCGKEFVARRRGVHHYCTRDCARAKERERRREREKRHCKECGSVLNNSRGQMQFCSTKCKDKARERRLRQHKRSKTQEIDIRPVVPPIEWPSDAKKPTRRAATLAAAPPVPSKAALHRGEALTGACGAVSYGSRQAGSKACE